MSCRFCSICYFHCLNLLKWSNLSFNLFYWSNYFFFETWSTKRVTRYIVFFFLWIVLNIFIIFVWLFFLHVWLQKSFLFNIFLIFLVLILILILICFSRILKLLTKCLVLKMAKWKSMILRRLNALNCCHIIYEQICKGFFIWVIKSGRLRDCPKGLIIMLTRVKSLTKIFFIKKIITIIFTYFLYTSSIWLV